MKGNILKIWLLSIVVLIFGLGFFSIAKADVNPQIYYQAKLTDNADVTKADGSYNFRFRLCSTADCGGGGVLWTEVRCYSPDSGTTCDGTGVDQRVSSTKGLVNVTLGSINNTLNTINFNQTVYLEVSVGGSDATPLWETLTPRKALGSVVSAFESAKLGGKAESAFGTLAENETVSGAWTFSNMLAVTANSASPALTVIQSGAGKGLQLGDGSTSSTISKDTLIVGQDAINDLGRFYVDIVGNINASGTLNILGTVSSTIYSGLQVTGTGGGLKVSSLLGCDTVDTDENGYFVCGSDATGGLGAATSNYSSPLTVTDGTTTSTLGANFLSIASSTAAMQGIFYVDNLGNTSVSGTAKIFGVATFNSDVVFNGVSAPLWGLVSAPNSINNQMGFNFATTTAGGIGQEPILVIQSTSTGALNYSRVAVGTTTVWGGAGLRDQFTVDGRMYSTWRYLACDVPGSSAISGVGVASDDKSFCGGNFSLDILNNGTATPVGSYPPCTRLLAGNGAAAAGYGAVFRTENRIAAPEQNAVFEALVSIPTPGAVVPTSSVQWLIGFVDSGYGTNSEDASNGVYFAASSTNWVAVSRHLMNGETNVVTSFATSTADFRRFRIEMSSTKVTYLIDGNVVAEISGGTIPTQHMMSAMVSVELLRVSTVKVNYFDVSYIRLWVDDPPGGFVAAKDDSSVEQKVESPSDYTSDSNNGIWYDKNDSTEDIPTGSLVAINKFDAGKGTVTVIPTDQAYQADAIGVVIEPPMSIIGNGKVPVALSGRVDVIVNDESGPISPGDYLVASSKKGEAMKAILAGQVVGQALTGYSGKGTGKLVMMVKPAYYQGARLIDLLALNSMEPQKTISQQILSLLTNKEYSSTSTQYGSDILTNNIAANLEIISPKLTTREIYLSAISANDENGISMNLTDTNKFIINGLVTSSGVSSSTQVAYVDNLGNANFVGTLTAGKIKAEQIEGFDEVKNKVEELSLAVDTLKSSISEIKLKEVFNSLVPLEPGEVVISAGGEDVDRYDNTKNLPLLGVVSKKEEDAGEKNNRYSVILSGRAPVRVAAENGPIKIGDMLVPGKIPGMAMKAVDPGMVIGMALENYENISATSSEGEVVSSTIMVMVNPHWYIGQINNDGVFAGIDEEKNSILDTFTLAVKRSLAKLGLFVENGVMNVAKIVSDTVVAKKVQLDAFELKDSKTGEVYCTWMQNGLMMNVKGDCTSMDDNATHVNNTVEMNTPIVDTVPAPSSSPDTAPTTNPEVAGEVQSSSVGPEVPPVSAPVEPPAAPVENIQNIEAPPIVEQSQMEPTTSPEPVVPAPSVVIEQPAVPPNVETTAAPPPLVTTETSNDIN